MIGKEIIKGNYIPISEVKVLMEKRREKYEDEEFSYEHGCAWDYVLKFSKLDYENAKNLLNELLELGIDEKTSVKIVDILPKDEIDLKVIYYKKDLPSNYKEIINTVAKYI